LAETLARKIGKKIVRFREVRGLTAEQLAYQNGISKGYLSQLENGKYLPSLKMLEKIAKALDVPLRDFF
jgi:transcriptional regulator with XRE-family HTH domain